MKTQTRLLNCILIIALSCFFEMAKAQWSKKDAGYTGTPQKGINEMIAVNSKVAWGIAYERNNAFVNPLTDFTRTIDGGKNWISGNISSQPDQFIVGLSPLSANTAYVLTCDINFNGKVLKTTDGGITWTQLHVASYPAFYENIHFFNSNDGVIIADTVVTSEDHFLAMYTTNDGGHHWTQVPDANLPAHDIGEGGYIFSMSAIGDTIWTISLEARVWRSTDKGLHWSAFATPETEAFVSNIKMRDSQHGLWGINDELYRTSDGGETWEDVNPTGTFFTFDLAYVPGTASTWVSTGGDTSQNDFFPGALHGLGSSYSTDDGNTWITIDTGVDHLALAMVNSYTGFCGGFDKVSGKGGVFNYTGSALGYSCGDNFTEMCVHGNSVCAPHNAIQKILNHGGSLGECSDLNRTGSNDESHLITSYPNPLSTFTTISFSLPQSENASLQIFDAEGRLIRTLVNESVNEGTHTLVWDARDENGNEVNAGIYFLRIETVNEVKSIALSIVR